jgi:hypothetical protein
VKEYKGKRLGRCVLAKNFFLLRKDELNKPRHQNLPNHGGSHELPDFIPWGEWNFSNFSTKGVKRSDGGKKRATDLQNRERTLSRY